MNNETVTNIANRSAMAKGNKDNSSPMTKCSAYRKYVKSHNISIRNDYAKIEKQKAENKEELSNKKAEEKNFELDEAFRTMVKVKQDILTNTIDRLASNTQSAIKKFTMLPPRQEHITEINTAESRIDKMSETEFQMHIEKYADNYQESAYFHDIACKHGKDYDLPFEPEEALVFLNRYVLLIKEIVIANIADDPMNHIDMATYFNGDEAKEIYGELNFYASYLDNLPIHVDNENPIPELENQQKIESDLLKTRQTYWNNNAKALWEECVSVNMDIQQNGLTSDNITKANRLSKIANELFPESKNEQKG